MRLLFATALISGIVLLVGCGGSRSPEPRVVDGKSYGVTSVPFRGRWWHYYERGLSWAEGGFWAEAESDLRECLDLRDTDSRRARIYGMHFVQCFAHRELAAVLIERGNLDEAELEVRTSIGQEPSAKAEFLLERIERMRAHADTKSDSPIHITALRGDLLPVPLSHHGEMSLQLTAVERAVAQGVLVKGIFSGALHSLWAVGKNRETPIALSQNGEFSVALAEGETLGTRADAHDDLTLIALPTQPVTASLSIDGPGEGRRVAAETSWYRYEANGHDLRALEVSDQNDRQLAKVELRGIQAAGMLKLALATGEQRITFRLVSDQDAATAVERTVLVRPAPTQPPTLRANALLIPLQTSSGETEAGDDPLLLSALVNDGRFRLVEQRGDDILRTELELVEAGYVDRVTAVRAGRRLQARYVVVGSVGHQRSGIECYLRLINVETQELVATADAYASSSGDKDVESFFAALAGRLRQAFPILQGMLSAEGKDSFADVGKRDGAVKLMRFYALSERDQAQAGAEPAVSAVWEISDLDDERSRMRLVSGTSAAPNTVSE